MATKDSYGTECGGCGFVFSDYENEECHCDIEQKRLKVFGFVLLIIGFVFLIGLILF